MFNANNSALWFCYFFSREMDSNYIDDSFSQALPPVPMKTAGKARPHVNTSLTYNSDHKDDTVSSIDKASLSSREMSNESTYTDMTKGSKKKKRQKSANLDDSISIESDEKSNSRDRLNIDFDTDVKAPKKKTKSNNKQQNARQVPETVAKISYRPEPTSSKSQPNMKSGQITATEKTYNRHQSPPFTHEVRKPPYQYPRANPDILSGTGPNRTSPYYNPPSPTQRKRMPYVYPRNEATTSGRGSPFSYHYPNNKQPSKYPDSFA